MAKEYFVFVKQPTELYGSDISQLKPADPYILKQVQEADEWEVASKKFVSNIAEEIISEIGTAGAEILNPLLAYAKQGIEYMLTTDKIIKMFQENRPLEEIASELKIKGLASAIIGGIFSGPVGALPGTILYAEGSNMENYAAMLDKGYIFLGQYSYPNMLSIKDLEDNQDKYNTLTTSKKVGLPDPIAIDMDGDGIETISKDDSSAYFDMDKNGFAEKTGWVKGDDALLVRDINGDGIINDGGELFGDQILKADGTKAANGFEALGELDSNKDGKITADDAEFNTLHIWQDKSSQGYLAA